ncbi:MAG: B12-binding domain-containing radical SAM protein, partial [Promethearchaeota archaeon]
MIDRKNRLLLCQTLRVDTAYFYIFSGLRQYRDILLKSNPEMEEWFGETLFDFDPLLPNRLTVDNWTNGANVPGHFLATNIETPTKVLDGAASPPRIIKELQKAQERGRPFTHVGFSVNVNSYSVFVQCVRAIRQFDPTIQIIAGNVGALFEETKRYVDYICRGDGVPFLRKLFGEKVNGPYNLALIKNKQVTRVFGLKTKVDLIELVTKIGCPMKCDFCITNQLYEGKFTEVFFTPQQVHDAIVEYRHKAKRDFLLGICEPTAITNQKWWEELFELFEGDPDDYPISIATTLSSLKRLDYEKISRSSLRINWINVGIESFVKDYAKNQKHKDTKKIIKTLNDYGIATWASFIIGFDHQTKQSIWEEIHQLLELGATFYAVLNLKALPGTPLWNRFKQEGRLLNVSSDFYYIDGFQAFTHPHFRPGFEDMLPLLYDINKYIEQEIGFRGLPMVKLLQNVRIQRDSFEKDITTMKGLAELLFPSWKKHLNPTQEQIERYLSQIGDLPEIPQYLQKAAE